MSVLVRPGVLETTITQGTGTVTLLEVQGYVRFSAAFAVGKSVCYCIKNGNNWEWGIGTIGAANTLERTSRIATYVNGVFNTSSPSTIDLSGTSEVFCADAFGSIFRGSGGISTNVALGFDTLRNNTTGSSNTAAGSNALQNNTTGIGNTAAGINALRSNTIGNYNAAAGVNALYSNTTGGNNTAAGTSALYNNTTGNSNTAAGINALQNNTTGSSNTAAGTSALYNNTTGICNTAVGSNALQNNTTGSGNICIGARNAANVYAPAYDITTENNYVSIGTTSTTNAYIQVAWTTGSDGRDKTNIEDLDIGLDAILALRPVSYERRLERHTQITDGRTRYGFIAQELAQTPVGQVVVDASREEQLSVTTEYLVPVLVRAVQELSAKVAMLEARMAE